MDEPLAFPMHRTNPLDPPPQYRRLRLEHPITTVMLPSGQQAWLVTSHKYVRQLLADPRVSSDREHPNFPYPMRPNATEDRGEPGQFSKSLIGLDPPEHSAARRMVAGEFTVKRLRPLQPDIQGYVDEIIGKLLAAGPPADLVPALSLPVPCMVICEQLGVPYADREFFQARTRKLVSSSTDPKELFDAAQELYGYLDEFTQRREREPADDLIGRLIVNNLQTGVFNHQQLVGMIFLLLLGGYETTANQISLSIVGLLQNSRMLGMLTSDSVMTNKIVEELLRYFTIMDSLFRVAADDIEIDGVTIRKDDGIVLSIGSANRDDNIFDNPDDVDINRGAQHHVAFAHGIHQCLGQNLARMELEIVLHTLFTRVPGLRLATTVERLPFKYDGNLYGIYELPVTWLPVRTV